MKQRCNIIISDAQITKIEREASHRMVNVSTVIIDSVYFYYRYFRNAPISKTSKGHLPDTIQVTFDQKFYDQIKGIAKEKKVRFHDIVAFAIEKYFEISKVIDERFGL